MTQRLIIPIALLVASVLPLQQGSAQVRPNSTWRQIASTHFNVIYEDGLDSIARRAVQRAEHEYARLAAQLVTAPDGRIDLVIADNSDISNGNARAFPDNRVTVWIRPPVEELSLQAYHDWMDLLITHELTHIFHHEPTSRLGRGLRKLFGRVPFPWPFFPVLGLPRWHTEGLATLIESRHTGAGRLNSGYHEMVARMAVLENDVPTIDRVSGETPLWPGGARAYIYGSLFMDYIARRYGETAQQDIIEKTASSLLPPPWRFDAIAKKALGKSFSDLYADWTAELKQTYGALADSLATEALTQPERLTEAGRWAKHPRFAPDGRRIAYAEENGRDVASTRVLNLEDRSDERFRRNGIGTIAWLPDGSGYVTEHLDFTDRYTIRSDLVLVRNGEERWLTRGGRAESPDVSPDGERIVYVQNRAGSMRLVLHDITTGSERVIVERSPDVHYTLPRFSPDGRRIAVQRWQRDAGHDIVVFTDAGVIDRVVATRGTDAAPVWSPDGRYLLFTSDRTGITNIYAAQADSLWQVTNVLGGAFDPDVSPDGASIVYAGYHADGFHIERIAFDPAAWRTPQPDRRADARRVPPAIADNRAAPVGLTTPTPYSPLASLRPRFWVPFVAVDSVAGEFFGATTAGEDAVGRHAYYATLGYDFERGRVAGEFSYLWAGLGNPELGLEAARTWDNTGLVNVRDSTGAVVRRENSWEREDRIGLSATFVNRRWRSSRVLQLGIEGVELNRRTTGAARFRDPSDRYFGVTGAVAYANYRRPALAISAEDGVRASFGARRRFEIEPGERDASYTQLTFSGAAFKSAGGGGYAHNVFAARVNAVERTEFGAGPTDAGGVDGFLPVRGYDDDTRIGFRAWSATLEYRVPLALVARGYRLRPVFVDRIAGALFVDAGNASCSAEQSAVYRSCAGNPDRPSSTLIGAGFELKANVALLIFSPTWLRAGIGFPLAGERGSAQVYLTFQPEF